MRRVSLGLVLGLLLTLLAGCGDERPRAPSGAFVLTRATNWLWAQQAEDGGWHSETYGLLRSGQSLTPFVLDALLASSRDPGARDDPRVRKAVRFILQHTTDEGAVGRLDEALEDYPCYATALAVTALARLGGHEASIRRMQDWLLGQQLTQQHGWTEAHPAYGAWGMGGEPRTPPEPGPIDISMTRHVVEALAIGDEFPVRTRAAFGAADVFLRRLASPADASSAVGFFFSTTAPDKNKAGQGPAGRSRPYGTSTADAALMSMALVLLDPRVGEPIDWLARHHRADRVPGLPESEDDGWALSMLFYYRAASARVFERAGIGQAPRGRAWRTDLVYRLFLEQHEDGRFENQGTLMQEDDPLIATGFAVRALGAAGR